MFIHNYFKILNWFNLIEIQSGRRRKNNRNLKISSVTDIKQTHLHKWTVWTAQPTWECASFSLKRKNLLPWELLLPSNTTKIKTHSNILNLTDILLFTIKTQTRSNLNKYEQMLQARDRSLWLVRISLVLYN